MGAPPAARQAAAAHHTATAGHAATKPLARCVTLFVLPPSPPHHALLTTADPDRQIQMGMHRRGELLP